VRRPAIYVAPVPQNGDGDAPRAMRPSVGAADRRSSFVEAEVVLSETAARREARRCLRCDLEFTKPREQPSQKPQPVAEA
jgi:hypothetical protein